MTLITSTGRPRHYNCLTSLGTYTRRNKVATTLLRAGLLHAVVDIGMDDIGSCGTDIHKWKSAATSESPPPPDLGADAAGSR